MSRVDGRGRSLALHAAPRRIVSLVPSTTETLFALGLGSRVVGVTRFCVHPEEVRAIPKVGGTKDVDVAVVRALSPDLILGNCEENTREIFDDLAGLPLWAAFPRDVDGAIEDLRAVGDLTGTEEAASTWAAKILEERAALHAIARLRGPFRWAYLIWRRPWMCAGADTFIASMLAEAGGVEGLHLTDQRFPTVEPASLAEVDWVLLSSEPFPFRERHRDELVKHGVPFSKIRFIDGELCSWHGVRMARAFPMLARWITEGFPLHPADSDREV